jgi:hypothetical protein
MVRGNSDGTNEGTHDRDGTRPRGAPAGPVRRGGSRVEGWEAAPAAPYRPPPPHAPPTTPPLVWYQGVRARK